MAKHSRSDTIQLKVRMKEPLRAAIEASAKKRGISLNAETVRRIEASFEAERRESLIAAEATSSVYFSFGGLDNFMVLRLLANAISTMEQTSGRKWREDPALFAEVKKATVQILNFFKPGEEAPAPFISNELLAVGVVASESDHLGHKTAAKVIETWLERIRLVEALRGAGHLEEAAKEE